MKLLLTTVILSIALLLSGCSKNNEINKQYSIGIIQYTNTNTKTLFGFKDKLYSLGFIEGENTTYIDYGYAKSFDEIQQKLVKIMTQNPDIIFSSTTPASIAAYKIAKKDNIPVVFAPVNDPVKAGIITNLKAPGEHITGVRLGSSDDKRLEWLTILNKETKRVLVPHNPKDKSANTTIETIKHAATTLGVELILKPIHSKEEFNTLLANLPDDIQAIFLPRDGFIMSRNKDFAKACQEKKIVLSTPRYEHVQDGATTGYGFIGYVVGKQAARIAGAILNGTPPGDIPVETAEDYFFINIEVLNKINLKVGNNILRQAYKE